MDDERVDPRADIVLAVLVLALAAVVFNATLALPPSRWEPLGPASLPQALTGLLAAFSLIVLVRGVRGLRRGESPAQEALPYTPRPGRAVTAYLVTAAFIAVMDLRLVGFFAGSVVYLVVLGLVLTGFRWRSMPYVVGFALVLVGVCAIVFTRIFYIDLP